MGFLVVKYAGRQTSSGEIKPADEVMDKILSSLRTGGEPDHLPQKLRPPYSITLFFPFNHLQRSNLLHVLVI